MSPLRRILPRADTTIVLQTVQQRLAIVEIEPPSPEGQPAVVWFGPQAHEVATLGIVVDPVVGFDYLLVRRDERDPATARTVEELDLVTEQELLDQPVDVPEVAAEVALMLGVVADVPWSAEVDAFIAALERHESIGVEASAALARQYRAAIEAASLPPSG